MTVLTAITSAQIERLEETFAALSDAGWTIPPWLTLLREAVEANEARAPLTADHVPLAAEPNTPQSM